MNRKILTDSPSSINDANYQYVKPEIHSDSLFTFSKRLEWVIEQLKEKELNVRYVEEDLKYLHIRNNKKMFIAMKCFCDTNISKLPKHTEWYGSYGIGFYKSWGLNHNLQPIIYINTKSLYYNDCKEVYNKLFKNAFSEEETSFLLHNLLYMKPYQGKAKRNGRKRMESKTFIDENEWRYIPCLDEMGMIPFAFESKQNEVPLLNDIIMMDKEAKLKFEYKDVKYIAVNSANDRIELIDNIKEWDIDDISKMELIAKVLVLDEIKDDV